MGKLTATMVVDITDRTGSKTQTIIGNLDRLKRAERDRSLAERGLSLNRLQRAQEREMIERARAQEDASRKLAARMMFFGTAGATAVTAATVAAGRAYSTFADIEDEVAGIVINADKGTEAIKPTMEALRKVALDSKSSFGTVKEGLDALVASGRSLDEAMSFLPSVALTAKASRANIGDIARSADAVGGSFKIAGKDMQQAFDMLVTGGKLGKFELKDMAQFLPSLAPSFAALGYEGTDGLAKLVAMLQTVRMQAGSSGEAATYLSNVLNKMYSEDVSKRFAKFGIDLPKALTKAKREGKDVLDVFVDMTELAIKGDLSRITNLFGDAEMQKGMRALVMLRDEQRRFNKEVSQAKGSALADFNAQADLSKSKIQELSSNWDEFTTNLGAGVATGLNPMLDKLNEIIKKQREVAQSQVNMDPEQQIWRRQDFERRYREQNPDASYLDIRRAYDEAQAKVGRGEAKDVFEGIVAEENRRRLDADRRRGGEATAAYPSRGTYDPQAQAAGADRQPLGTSSPGMRTVRNIKDFIGDLPIPTPRPTPETPEQRREREDAAVQDLRRAYPSPGSYDPGVQAASSEPSLVGRFIERHPRLKALLENDTPSFREAVLQRKPEPSGPPIGVTRTAYEDLGKPQELSGAARIILDDARRAREAGMGGTTDTLPGKQADDLNVGVRSVTIDGTPSVTLTGTPMVTITNPPPRPNINVTMSVTINEAANAQAVAQQLGQAVRGEMDGLQSSTNDAGL